MTGWRLFPHEQESRRLADLARTLPSETRLSLRVDDSEWGIVCGSLPRIYNGAFVGTLGHFGHVNATTPEGHGRPLLAHVFGSPTPRPYEIEGAYPATNDL